jgi:hypothetical protein
MVPLPTFPDTWMLSRAGTSGPSGGRTLTVPLRIDTSSASTTMPGSKAGQTLPAPVIGITAAG